MNFSWYFLLILSSLSFDNLSSSSGLISFKSVCAFFAKSRSPTENKFNTESARFAILSVNRDNAPPDSQ